MHRIVASVTTLAQHLLLLAEEPERYRPAVCPHCGVAKPSRHGYYERKAVRSIALAVASDPIPVPRFRCRGCSRTCSRLPACLAPRRWYGWEAQQVLLLWLSAGGSLRAAAGHCKIDQHTARRWRDWLVQRGELFAFYLRSRFADWGRAPDMTQFWRTTLVERSLQTLMAWLDRDLVVP